MQHVKKENENVCNVSRVGTGWEQKMHLDQKMVKGGAHG